MQDKFMNLQPMSKNKSFYNQNGTYSAIGFINNQKVKIYSPQDKKAINLRLFLENSICKKYFPKIIYYDDIYIAEEWIDAPTLTQCNKQFAYNDLILEFIYDLQKLKYDKIVFDYIKFIFKRINKLNDSLLKKVNNLNIPAKINNNDLHPDNILLTSNEIKIVDNEFLGNSHAWILNIKNSFLDDDEKFYNKYIDSQTLNDLWEIRKLWKK